MCSTFVGKSTLYHIRCEMLTVFFRVFLRAIQLHADSMLETKETTCWNTIHWTNIALEPLFGALIFFSAATIHTLQRYNMIVANQYGTMLCRTLNSVSNWCISAPRAPFRHNSKSIYMRMQMRIWNAFANSKKTFSSFLSKCAQSHKPTKNEEK